MRRTESNGMSWFYALIIAILVIAGMLIYITYKEHTSAPVQFFSAVGTVNDGGDIRIYVWTDPDSQRTYLITDRGGICERNLSAREEDEDVPEVRTQDD